MSERGWSAEPSVVAQHRVLLWLAAQYANEPSRLPGVQDAAAALDIDVDTAAAAADALALDDSVRVHRTFDVGATSLQITDQGRAVASRWSAARQAKSKRRVACRDALVNWLDANESVESANGFLEDTRSYVFGEQFTQADLYEATAFLMEVGLVHGQKSWQGPSLRPGLTAEGRVCVERYDSSVSAWQERATAASSFTVTNTGTMNLAHNSPDAVQSIEISVDARQQVLHIADTLERSTSALGLTPEDVERARQIAADLRTEVAADKPNAGRLKWLLRAAGTLAMGAAGSAAGDWLLELIRQGMQALG